MLAMTSSAVAILAFGEEKSSPKQASDPRYRSRFSLMSGGKTWVWKSIITAQVYPNATWRAKGSGFEAAWLLNRRLLA